MSRLGSKAEQEQQSQLAIDSHKRQLAVLADKLAECKQKKSDLIDRIQQQANVNAQKQNSITATHHPSAVESDIRNSQLVTSAGLERMRWLKAERGDQVSIAGTEQEIANKRTELEEEERSTVQVQLIRLMKKKLQFLKQMAGLKQDSGLFVSHQRVLIKQYLQTVRSSNSQLQEENRRGQQLQQEYQKAEFRLENSAAALRAVMIQER